MGDYGAAIGEGLGIIAQLVNAGYTQAQAQKIAQASYDKAQGNISQMRDDFNAVGTPNYKSIDPRSTQLGDTELKGIQVDAQGRGAEQQAMAQLQQLADNGGLSLADTQALNEIQGNLNRNNAARQKATENQFAARGQLGSGAQLAMALQGNQDAAQRANQAGESQAAQAQARAMQALTQRASLGREMSQDEYQRKSDAARAADLIKNRNMENSIGAQKYNNTELSQGFEDRYKIAQGKSGLIPGSNAITLAAGQSAANNALAGGTLRGGAINAARDAFGNIIDGATKPSGGGGQTQPTAPPLVGADTGNPDDWSKFSSGGSGNSIVEEDDK